MKWIVKAALQNALGRLPAPLADPLYHGLQQGMRPIPIEIQGQRSFLNETASFVQDIRGIQLSGLKVVEVGSGWYPVLPLLLICESGAREVHTFDVNHHYSSARIAHAAREIMKAVEPLRENSLLKQTSATGQLPDTIRYYPRMKVQQLAEMAGGPADLALSRSVLEYATPEEIGDIHRSSLRWLTADAIWFHLIGTSDDRARQDKSVNQFGFLKYSEKEWMRISGNRYGYKNRLRLPEYRTVFQSAGWRVAREKATVSDAAIAKLGAVAVHAQFAQFSPQDLVAGALRFALVR